MIGAYPIGSAPVGALSLSYNTEESGEIMKVFSPQSLGSNRIFRVQSVTVSETGDGTANISGIQSNIYLGQIIATGATIINGTATCIGIPVQSSLGTVTAVGTTVINGSVNVTGLFCTASLGVVTVTTDLLKNVEINIIGLPARAKQGHVVSRIRDQISSFGYRFNIKDID